MVAGAAATDAERRTQRRVERRLRQSAHLPAPVIVRGFLSDAEVRQIFAFSREMHVEDGAGLARYGDAHVALFLHHGGAMADNVWRDFATACPALLGKMLATARQHAGDAGMCPLAKPLNVRCIEMHLYTCGGGLTDPGHYDQGSTISKPPLNLTFIAIPLETAELATG